ncbi:Alkaline elastase YaB precursor [Planctomycetes bacterium Poly30]|uniref:Alkaline elastase YaB n=1 Tax=Saltatorellus ferox TaxID=2528018 RepID=A0A518ENX4_9BACT|nr:Alkaline elastase YaB precursor [Planctomycetes bacterium Poly30]
MTHPKTIQLTLASILALTCTPGLAAAQDLPLSTRLQINAVQAEKRARTAFEQKLETSLLYLARESAGQLAVEGVPSMRSRLTPEEDGRVCVDLDALPGAALHAFIESGGGVVEFESTRFESIRARVLPSALLELSQRSDVRRVRKGHQPIRHTGSVTSEGDATHKADSSRTLYGVDGTGVQVGVISDSADGSANSISLGDLPAGFTVLPGFFGSGSGEGTAMSEIVHDLAPGAEIFFASAEGGKAAFASAILQLKAAGCDVIVDDISYGNEWQFQDDVIGQAVNEVVAGGAVYLSSSGNEGSLYRGNSTTWEGDFLDDGPGAGPLSGAGRVHSFGGQNWNTVVGDPSNGTLQWSDEYNSSSNDYDLFVLNAAGTAVVSSSTDTQNGTQEPFEFVYDVQPGERIVVVKFGATAEDRYLRLSFTGAPLLIGTEGQTIGHAGTPSCICVAATEAPAAFPNPFSTFSMTEISSSDGPHRQFYLPDGTPITPGNFLASGGVTILTPALTAADGVVTTLPPTSGLNPFYGTSAAAPHAAAIAALLIERNPALSNLQIRAALESSCLDIEAPGFDVNSGNGVLMADLALANVSPEPIGTAYCTATANSTGVPGELAALGSPFVSVNFVKLVADQLPQNAFTLFLASRTQDFVPAMNSMGNLCLGGSIGRGVGGQVYFSGAAGAVEASANLFAIPMPTGTVAVMPGDTWNFQAWSRDAVGGVATSNFTNGVQVTFQ